MESSSRRRSTSPIDATISAGGVRGLADGGGGKGWRPSLSGTSSKGLSATDFSPEEEFGSTTAAASGAGASVGDANGTKAGCGRGTGEIGRGNRNELEIDETEAGRTGSGTRGGVGRFRRTTIGDNRGEGERFTAERFGAAGDLRAM